MIPKITNIQAQEAALLLKDIIIDYYKNEQNFAEYIEWLKEQPPSDLACTAERKRLGIAV